MNPLLIETALAANAALALALFMFIKWRKTMDNADSIAALISRQTDFAKQSSVLADQVVPAIAELQVAAGDLVTAANALTGLVPQSILDAAKADSDAGINTQSILDSWKDTLAKTQSATANLNNAAAALKPAP